MSQPHNDTTGSAIGQILLMGYYQFDHGCSVGMFEMAPSGRLVSSTDTAAQLCGRKKCPGSDAGALQADDRSYWLATLCNPA
jgi:hypothetical protein